jgi:drug/metabolite transporter (DMT)-like permease
VLGVVLNQGLYLEGLQRSTAMNTGLLICLIPVFTFILAAAVGQERFEWVRAVGVALAMAGAAPLFFARGANPLEHATGSVLLAANSFCYSIFLVLSKRLMARHSPWLVIAWVYLFSLPGALWFGLRAPLLPADLHSTRAWGSLAAILIFATILGYALNLFALSRVRATTTAVYIYVQPLIAGAGAVLLLGEAFTRGTLRAGVLMFLGIWLVARRGKG